MNVNQIFSILFASVLCFNCIVNVHTQSTTIDATTPISSQETTQTGGGETESQTPTNTSTAGPTVGSATGTETGGSTDETGGSSTVPPTVSTSQQPGGSSVSTSQQPGGSSVSTSQQPGGSSVSTSQQPGGSSVITVTIAPGNISTTSPGVPGNDTTDNAPVSPGSGLPTNHTTSTVSISGTSTVIPDVSSKTPSPAPEVETSSTMTSASSATSVVTSTTPGAPVVTTQPQLSTQYPPSDPNTDIATYTLSLVFDGENDNPSTECNATYLQDQLDTSLQRTTGYRHIQTLENSREFVVFYGAKVLVTRPVDAIEMELNDALNVSNDCYTYSNTALSNTIATFAALTRNYCKANYICTLGYTCKTRNSEPVCISLCEDMTCENKGECRVQINNDDATASATCRCVDTADSVHSGDRCQISRMNPERVAAIVGGVLGAVCLILLVALYCTCYRNRDGSGKKYQLSGVYNETYDHSSLDMKNM